MPHGVEKAPVAVRTARQHGHRVEEMDVGDFGGMESPFGTDLLIGGPPCQPFSPAGSRLGRYDPRDGFKLVYNVIDELSPRRVVFENVPDFLLGKNAAYAKEVLDNLGSRFAAVGVWKLNAKDFGVPQDRERVFIWAAERPMAPPVPTHGPRADQSYKTVRQALPHVAKQAPAILVRNTTAKSRSIDEPSPTVTTRRTLYTATRPGLVYPQPASKQGRILYPEETKILQGFPEFYSFRGTLDQQQIQIGNAVPPALGEAVVSAMTADLIVQPLTPEEVLGRLFAENPSALLVEPREIFDRAIVGVTNLPAPQADPLGSRPLRVVYDYMGMVYAAADDASASAGELDDDEREEFFMEALDWVDRIDFRSAGSNAPEIVRFDDDDPRWE
jgi:site-specific DNA-cytosine methylase